MTIQEAAKKWNIKENTVLKYIYKGYILGISVNENHIILPDILKPNVKSNKPKTVALVDKYIMDTLNIFGYVSYPILNIDKEIFAERLNELERKDFIHKKDNNCNDYYSSANFTLAHNEAYKQFVLSLTFAPTFSPKIGLINT